MNVLKIGMTNEGNFYLPKVRLRFGRSGVWSPSFHALLDTGASYSIATMDVADTLGISREEIQSSDSMPLTGLGGSRVWGYKLTLDIEFGQYNGRGPLLIESIPMYVVATNLPHRVQVLLGQDDAFRKVAFVQRNFGPKPYFSLAKANG